MIARLAVEAAEEKLAQDVLVLDVSEKLGIAEVFVIVSGANDRQVGAIVDEIEKRSHLAGCKPLYREGTGETSWVLLDYFDVVVHIQHVEARVRYSLDRLWKDCPTITFAPALTD
jgi:ribosome-associated protein